MAVTDRTTQQGEYAQGWGTGPGNRSGRAWKLVQDNVDPRKRVWHLVDVITGKVYDKKTGSLTVGGNIAEWSKGGIRNIKQLLIDQTKRTQAKNKLMIDQGYVMNSRGRWTKPNPFTPSDLDNEEVVNENIEEEEKKLVVPPSPVDIAAVQEYVEKPEDDGYRKAQNFTSGKPINENDPYTQLSNAVSNLTGLKINQDNNNDQGGEKPKTSKDLKVNKSKGSIYGLSREEWQRATKNQRDRAKRLSNNNSRAPLIGGVGTRRYIAGFRD